MYVATARTNLAKKSNVVVSPRSAFGAPGDAQNPTLLCYIGELQLDGNEGECLSRSETIYVHFIPLTRSQSSNQTF